MAKEFLNFSKVSYKEAKEFGKNQRNQPSPFSKKTTTNDKNYKSMEKKKMNTKKVVTLIKIDKDGNYEVFNWVAECKKEARQIVEATVKEIREEWKDRLDEHNRVYTDERLTLTKEWVSADNCHLYFGDGNPSMEDWFESKFQYNFFITDSEN